jgi:hypothetical protein
MKPYPVTDDKHHCIRTVNLFNATIQRRDVASGEILHTNYLYVFESLKRSE